MLNLLFIDDFPKNSMVIRPPRGSIPNTSEMLTVTADIPNLRNGEWTKTGESTVEGGSQPYNCFAWSLCRDDIGWLYGVIGKDSQAPRIEDFDKYYQSMGYEICGMSIRDCSHQKGQKKIALFGKGGKIIHAAKEVEYEGWWESKMGSNIRIMHRLEQMEGGRYGDVCRCYRTKEAA